jgi:hypothetical protein
VNSRNAHSDTSPMAQGKLTAAAKHQHHTESTHHADTSSTTKPHSSMLQEQQHNGALIRVPVVVWVVLGRHAVASDEESAGLVLQQMAEDGVHPNEYTFTALLKLYGRTGSVDKAEVRVTLCLPERLRPEPPDAIIRRLAVQCSYSDAVSTDEPEHRGTEPPVRLQRPDPPLASRGSQPCF